MAEQTVKHIISQLAELNEDELSSVYAAVVEKQRENLKVKQEKAREAAAATATVINIFFISIAITIQVARFWLIGQIYIIVSTFLLNLCDYRLLKNEKILKICGPVGSCSLCYGILPQKRKRETVHDR